MVRHIARHQPWIPRPPSHGPWRPLQAQYDLPERTRQGEVLSEECAALLQMILVANPAERLSVAQIQEHPWVTKGLPEGIATFNTRWMARCQSPRFDMARIKEIVRQAKFVGRDSVHL